MLRWRLLIGIPLVALIAALCWFDSHGPAQGLLLMPFFLVCVVFLCKETLALLNAGGVYPRRTTIYVGVLGTLVLCWVSCWNSTSFAPSPSSGGEIPNAVAFDAVATSSAGDEDPNWKTAADSCLHVLLAIAAGVLIAFVGEMLRFKLPGGHMINLSGAVFAIVYLGALGSFIVLLRLAFGLMALVSMILVAKMCDIGAYAVGRMIGRHKMAPSLSPGKTIEGIVGGLAFSVIASYCCVKFLFPLATDGASSSTSLWGIVVYGLVVGASGALGDLAESLIKRDVSRKDSGTNVPGFGGFLDMFDSLLLAAPVAFALWAFGLIRL